MGIFGAIQGTRVAVHQATASSAEEIPSARNTFASEIRTDNVREGSNEKMQEYCTSGETVLGLQVSEKRRQVPDLSPLNETIRCDRFKLSMVTTSAPYIPVGFGRLLYVCQTRMDTSLFTAGFDLSLTLR